MGRRTGSSHACTKGCYSLRCMTGVHAATRGCNERGQDMMAVMQGVCFTYRTPTSLAGKAVPQQHGGLRLLHKAQQPLRRSSDMCSDNCNGWAVGNHSRLHTRVCMHFMHALSEPALHRRFRRPTFWQWDGWWVESLQTRRDFAGRFGTGLRSLGNRRMHMAPLQLVPTPRVQQSRALHKGDCAIQSLRLKHICGLQRN